MLSSRGRGGFGKTGSDDILRVDGHSPTVVTAVVHLKSSSTTKPELQRGEHEAAEVQPQVYVKANDTDVTKTQSHRIPAPHPHPPEDPKTTTNDHMRTPHLRSPAHSHYLQDEGQVQVRSTTNKWLPSVQTHFQFEADAKFSFVVRIFVRTCITRFFLHNETL